MANFSHLIFDLDGTLVDSKPGLLNALRFVLGEMGLDLPAEELIDSLIGPPVQQGMRNILGFNDRQVEISSRLFREYYGEKGMYEGHVYPGIQLLLEALLADGAKLYIATSKQAVFLPAILRHFELERYFDDTEGSEGAALQTKAELITNLMDRNRLEPSHRIAMIGDTKFDVVGGKANEITTIAVGYGFGLNGDLQELDPDYFAEEVDDLTEILLG
ncbi:HAD hydrolase-like protein [Mangrovibacterium marinum]|uniref:Phosphoglycolate phosphatase n=1 Tax=Mangrovibacterium marinum TaxID=1639118 RepID=A0A2T5BXB4_9BACT|nr:HAD hydrolase-like protein [Mangrovibacterium marinum]PTN04811.1 phosphoglycolate phosphatase [Mangrovibacterium marinum]